MRCSRGANLCRNAVLRIRGTALEADCYCLRNDYECSQLQSTIYFRNPCFGNELYTINIFSKKRAHFSEEAKLTMIPRFTTRKPTKPPTTTTPTTTSASTTMIRQTTSTAMQIFTTKTTTETPFDVSTEENRSALRANKRLHSATKNRSQTCNNLYL